MSASENRHRVYLEDCRCGAAVNAKEHHFKRESVGVEVGAAANMDAPHLQSRAQGQARGADFFENVFE